MKTIIPASVMKRYSVILKLEEREKVGKNQSPFNKEWLVLKDEKLVSTHSHKALAIKAIREDALRGVQ